MTTSPHKDEDDSEIHQHEYKSLHTLKIFISVGNRVVSKSQTKYANHMTLTKHTLVFNTTPGSMNVKR